MNEKMMKLEELAKDEAKVAEIFTGTHEEMMEKLRMNGIELTQEEFSAICDGMRGTDEADTLSDEELTAVVGGCQGCYDFFKKVGKAIDKVLSRIFGR